MATEGIHDTNLGYLFLLGDDHLLEIENTLKYEPFLSQYSVTGQSAKGLRVTLINKEISTISTEWKENSRIFISLGAHDAYDGLKPKLFKRGIKKLITTIQSFGSLPILGTILPNPNHNLVVKKLIVEYNKVLYDIAREVGCKYIDIGQLMKNVGHEPSLATWKFPNFKRLYNKRLSYHLSRILERQHVTVLWQYNGYSAKCNYRCHYCYYIGLHHPKDVSPVSNKAWEHAFLDTFKMQRVVFYCAHGEPTFGEGFDEICDMVLRNPLWSLRITSNIDTDFIKNADHEIFQSGRFFVNASFHKMHINRDAFLENLLKLRSKGIECPIVYVAHPKYFDEWQADIEFFERHNFVVHLRRFQGDFLGKKYPAAYDMIERSTFVRFTDFGSAKFMLNGRNNNGDITFSGYDFFIVDNAGNVGFDSNAFAERSLNRSRLGNILTGSFRPMPCPSHYPGGFASTVDETANIYENEYRQLRNNNLFSFMEQGGVLKRSNSITYGNRNIDLTKAQNRSKLLLTPQTTIDHLFYIFGKQGTRNKIRGYKQQVRNYARSKQTLRNLYNRYKRS